MNFAVSRLDELLLVTARHDIRNGIDFRIDYEMLDNVISIRGALESFARREDAKIGRREYTQEFLVRFRSALGKNTDGRLPEGQSCFVGNKKAVC